MATATSNKAALPPKKFRLIRYASVVFLALLVGAGVIYYDYVSTQKTYYTERNFRLLATIHEELNKDLTNYEKVLRSISFSTPLKPKNSNNDNNVDKDVMKFDKVGAGCLKEPGSKTGESPPELNPKVKLAYVTLLCREQYHPRLRNVVIELKPRTQVVTFAAKTTEAWSALEIHAYQKKASQAGEKEKPIKLKAEEGGSLELVAESEEGSRHKVEVSLKKKSSGAVAVLDFKQPLVGRLSENDKRDWELHISAEITIQDLLSKLPTKGIFADLILADENGLVLFEQKDKRRPAALEFTSLDVLFPKEPSSGEPTGPSASVGSSGGGEKKRNTEQETRDVPLVKRLPALKEIDLGGTRHLLFAQPAVLPFGKHGTDRKPVEFILGGLIRTGDFWKQALALPASTILWVLLLTLGILFLLPVIKLWLMGPRDHFSMVDVLIFMFFSLMGTGLLAVGLLDFYLYQRTELNFDQGLKEAATSIQQHFNEELNVLQVQLTHHDLDYKDEDEKDCPQLDRVLSKNSKLKLPLSTDLSCLKMFPRGKTNDYPYVDQVFWVHQNGQVHAAWFQNDRQAQNINLKEREYIQHVVNDDLEDAIWLDAIESWTTGRQRVIIATKSIHKDDEVQKDKNALHEQLVAAMEVHLWSLTDPAVPDGFGLAVLNNDTGETLFHVDETQVLNQNFLLETDQNRQLRSFVYGRESGYVDSKYEGRDHRLYVMPLMGKDGVPWTLVVYRQKDVLRTVNVEALFFAMELFLAYTLVVLVIGLFGFLIVAALIQDKAEWMWPDRDRWKSYYIVLGIHCLLILIFCAFSWFRPFGIGNGWIALTSILIVLVGMALKVIILKRHPGKSSVGSSQAYDYRFGYTMMVTVLLILYAAVPACGFLAVAYDEEMKLLVLHAGKGLEDSVHRRLMHVKSDYARSLDDVAPRFLEKYGRDKSCTNQKAEQELEKTSVCIYEKYFEPRTTNNLSNLTRFGTYREFLQFNSEWNVNANWPTFFEQLHAFFRTWYNNEAEELGAFLPAEPAKQAVKGEGFWVHNSSHPFSSALAMGFLLAAGIIILFGTAYVKSKESQKKRYVVAVLLLLFFIDCIAAKYDLLMAGTILMMIVALLIQYVIPRFISERVFLLDFENPESDREMTASKEQLPSEVRYILHIFPHGESPPGEKLQDKKDLSIDIRNQNWFEYFVSQIESLGDKRVVFSHFEHMLGDPHNDRRKLECLETLVVKGCPVTVASTIDPFRAPCLLVGEQEGSDRQRWMSVFQLFVRIYSARNEKEELDNWEKQIREKCMPEENDTENKNKSPQIGNSGLQVFLEEYKINRSMRDIALKIVEDKVKRPALLEDLKSSRVEDVVVPPALDLARPYYEGIWETCSDDEKLALFHLAKHRFLHSKNPELRVLMQKKLILREPDLRMLNESFRRFVLEKGEQEEIDLLEQRGPASIWSIVSRPMSFSLLTVMIFLLATQEHLRTVTMGFLTMLPAFFAAFPRLFAAAQGARPPMVVPPAG